MLANYLDAAFSLLFLHVFHLATRAPSRTPALLPIHCRPAIRRSPIYWCVKPPLKPLRNHPDVAPMNNWHCLPCTPRQVIVIDSLLYWKASQNEIAIDRYSCIILIGSFKYPRPSTDLVFLSWAFYVPPTMFMPHSVVKPSELPILFSVLPYIILSTYLEPRRRGHITSWSAIAYKPLVT